MTQTSTYDRIMHSVGLLALGLLGMQANPDIYKHFPWWVIMAASLVAFVVQASTMPMTARPDTIIKAAKSGAVGGSLLPILLLVGMLVGLTACPPTVTPGIVPTPVQTFDACSDKVVEGKAMDIVGLIARATVGDDWQGALAEVAATYGWPEAKCAAQLFVSLMGKRASMDATALLQRQRAQTWLNSVTADAGT